MFWIVLDCTVPVLGALGAIKILEIQRTHKSQDQTEQFGGEVRAMHWLVLETKP